MADKRAEAKANKKQLKLNKKRLDVAMRAIIDNIVISKTDQWAYYKLSNNVYDFLSVDAKISNALSMSRSFAALMNDRKDPLDLHIITTSTPIDLNAWEEQVRENASDWSTTAGFETYMAKQRAYLQDKEYATKVTYLGIHLGKRGSFNVDMGSLVEAGLKDSFQTISDFVKNIGATGSGEKISQEEENEAKRREFNFFEILTNGNMHVERCTAEELLLITKRLMYPAMPSPYLQIDPGNRLGPGDLMVEAGHSISNHWNYLKFRQMVDGEEREGYRATITVSRLPKDINFPMYTMPFLYWPSVRGIPFDSYSRVTLMPNTRMQKILARKKKEHIDAQENAAKANLDDARLGMAPTELSEGLDEIHTMTDILAQSKDPWIYGYYYIVVVADTLEGLRQYCTKVRQEYNEIDVTTQWGNGTQSSLFLQQMPGDKLRVPQHKQITQLDYLTTSGFNFSSDVGDKLKTPTTIVQQKSGRRGGFTLDLSKGQGV